jgi:hypothetical protein
MNLGRRMVHQPYHDSFEIIHDPNPQVHHNPRVLDHVLLVIDYRKASQSYFYIINTGKLNADWSNKYHLQYNELCNKAIRDFSNDLYVRYLKDYRLDLLKVYDGIVGVQ